MDAEVIVAFIGLISGAIGATPAMIAALRSSRSAKQTAQDIKATIDDLHHHLMTPDHAFRHGVFERCLSTVLDEKELRRRFLEHLTASFENESSHRTIFLDRIGCLYWEIFDNRDKANGWVRKLLTEIFADRELLLKLQRELAKAELREQEISESPNAARMDDAQKLVLAFKKLGGNT